MILTWIDFFQNSSKSLLKPTKNKNALTIKIPKITKIAIKNLYDTLSSVSVPFLEFFQIKASSSIASREE